LPTECSPTAHRWVDSRSFHIRSSTLRRSAAAARPALSGGRTWWAHFEFTRINIEPIILKNKIEELMNVRGVGEKNFLKLKDHITVAPVKADHANQQ
jgi:hypothetical protein